MIETDTRNVQSNIVPETDTHLPSSNDVVDPSEISLPAQISVHALSSEESPISSENTSNTSNIGTSRETLCTLQSVANERCGTSLLTAETFKAHANARFADTFECAFVHEVYSQHKFFSVGKFDLPRMFNYLVPVVQKAMCEVEYYEESPNATVRLPLILVVVLGRRSTLEHVFNLAMMATHNSWINPVIYGPNYNNTTANTQLWVTSYEALLDIHNSGHISLGRVRYFVTDDGDAMFRRNFEEQSLYYTNRVLAEQAPECQRFMFTATPAPGSQCMANILAGGFAFMAYAKFQHCLNMTFSCYWDSQDMSGYENDQRIATVIYAPSERTAADIEKYLTERQFDCFAPEIPSIFDLWPEFDTLSQEEKNLAIYFHKREVSDYLFDIVEKFNTDELPILILSQNVTMHLQLDFLGALDCKAPTTKPRDKEYSFRLPAKKALWKRILKKKSAPKPLVTPLSADEIQQIREKSAIPRYARAKLRLDKIVINYNNLETSFEVFFRYGRRFEDATEFRRDQNLNRKVEVLTNRDKKAGFGVEFAGGPRNRGSGHSSMFFGMS